MITPKVEESRLRYAMRTCRERGYPIYAPRDLIMKAINKFDDSLAVACSFGQCSTIVLHMALELKPDIKVIFHNTGVQYPETYAYRDLLRKKWDLNPPQYIETKPLKSFWQCVKEYGFPLASRSGKGRPGKPKCCIYLKEKPFSKAAKEFDIKAILTGLRVVESRTRMFGIGQFGQFYFNKTLNVWKFHPIAFWKDRQIKEYFDDTGIPMNQIYLKGKFRSGCMPCTGFKDWEERLAKTNLRLYRYVQKLRGVALLDDFIELENETTNKCGQQSWEEWL